MEEKIVKVLNEMSGYLSIAQMKKLQEVIIRIFAENEAEKTNISNTEFLKMFLAAKRVEGCSERTIQYYRVTVDHMFTQIDSEVRKITTEDIRAFFSNVTSIGGSAFENLGRGYSKSESYDSGITLILPGKLKSIGTGGFKNTGFVNFQLGAPGDGCQLDYTTCGQSLFAAGSSNPLTIINFTIYTDNPSDAKWSLSDAQVASRLFASTNIPANYAVIDSNA